MSKFGQSEMQQSTGRDQYVNSKKETIKELYFRHSIHIVWRLIGPISVFSTMAVGMCIVV